MISIFWLAGKCYIPRGRKCRGGVVLGCTGTDEFARTAAKPTHPHTIFVHLGVRSIILTALFKIVYTPWMGGYFTVNNIPALFITLKEN